MRDRWDAGKKEHLALSTASVQVYDEIYENLNFATGSYMQYELQVIEHFVDQTSSKSYAVDLGCGTGRDSYLLSRYFDQVYACDLSPEGIQVAKGNKFAKGMGNVLFEVRDIEEGPLPFADNSVSFLNAGFGMGSFVKDLDRFFCEVHRVLQPQGIAIFSFYNALALVNQLKLEWKPALTARVMEGEDVLEVHFDRTYRISAKAYQPNEIKEKAEGNFRILQLTTFPTLSALFPQSLFENSQIKDLCRNVDQLLAGNLEIAGGPYIIAVCQKECLVR